VKSPLPPLPEVAAIGGTSFILQQVDGRANAVVYVVRDKIIDVAVSSPNPAACISKYSIIITMVGGTQRSLTSDSYEMTREFINSLGLGDVALAGILPPGQET
jgi:hypothetical protein